MSNEFPPKPRHPRDDDALDQALADAERNQDFACPSRRPFTEDFYGQGTDGPTEYSWGPGLVPRGKKFASPEHGGMYRGTTPRRGRPTARDYDAPGHPGERVR